MTDGDRICGASLAELSEWIRDRELGVLEVTIAHLERIARIDPLVHAFVTVTEDEARASAERLDREIAHGEWRGPLHGIPVALKDLFDMQGVGTTGNSRVHQGRVAPADATVVGRLRAAGAVLLGKLKLHEFAIAPARRDDHFAPARNPWDLARSPGGSSSGSAVALASGLCAGSLGSDTGGSIRTPSSLVGVVGLKPTYGLVSRHGILDLSWSLDHVGPMARRVRDVALILGTIAGRDPADPTTTGAPSGVDYTERLGRPIAGIRVGVPRRRINEVDITPPVLAAFERALHVLAELGAEVTDVELPLAEHSEVMQAAIRGPEMLAYHRPWLTSVPELYGREARKSMLDAAMYSADDYVDAQRARARLSREFAELFSRVAIVAMPTLRGTAPTFEEAESSGFRRSAFTGLFNLSGQPAVSLPCGFEKGLPIGLMLAARSFDEQTLLGVAHGYETATQWYERRPAAVWSQSIAARS